MRRLFLAVFVAAYALPSQASADDDVLVNTGSIVNLTFEGGARGTERSAIANEPVANAGYGVDSDGIAYQLEANVWVPCGTYIGFDGQWHWLLVRVTGGSLGDDKPTTKQAVESPGRDPKAGCPVIISTKS